LSSEHVEFVLTAVATFCLPSVLAAILLRERRGNGDVESAVSGSSGCTYQKGPTHGDVEAVALAKLMMHEQGWKRQSFCAVGLAFRASGYRNMRKSWGIDD
jgi:hypothetical protein